MGEYGLPALMKDAKRFKVRGKGHEVSVSSISPSFYLHVFLSSISLSPIVDASSISQSL
jgi:hypothetical protein